MNNAMFSERGQVKQPKIKRPIMSDADGTREGGLTFPTCKDMIKQFSSFDCSSTHILLPGD